MRPSAAALIVAIGLWSGISPAAAATNNQTVDVDEDNDPATPPLPIPVSGINKADVTTVVGQLNAVKNSNAFKLLVAQAHQFHSIRVDVERDAKRVQSAQSIGGIIIVDVGDWERLKNNPDMHFVGGLSADRAAVANQFLKEALIHEMAHAASPGLPHDDKAGNPGVISLANQALQELSLIAREQDADCDRGMGAGYANSVQVKLPTPAATGGWDEYFGPCYGEQASSVPAPGLLPALAAMLATALFQVRRRAKVAST